jgi:hypothetical protein
MKTFVYSLVGTDKLISDIKKLSENVQNRIDAEMRDTGEHIRDLAVNDAQAKIAPLDKQYDLTNFSGQITFYPVSKFHYEITSAHPLSAYFEFGTGQYVFENETWVDEELRKYAREFYINGLGTIPAKPYLFNNFYEQRIKMIERIKKIIGA